MVYTNHGSSLLARQKLERGSRDQDAEGDPRLVRLPQIWPLAAAERSASAAFLSVSESAWLHG